MGHEHAIQVNFGKPIPLFPLPTAVLLPQQVIPLHIFEPRYRQLVEEALEGSSQLAMAVFAGKEWQANYHGRPPLRPFVCVAQIVNHERLADGRFNILVHGVCRARIMHELPPSEERLYRAAYVEPVGLEPADLAPDAEETESEDPVEKVLGSLSSGSLDEDARLERLLEARDRLGEMLSTQPLSQLAETKPVLEFIRNEQIPTGPLLELVSFYLVKHPEVRYRLLAEPDVEERVKVLMGELGHLEGLLRAAERQRPNDWPRGCSWN